MLSLAPDVEAGRDMTAQPFVVPQRLRHPTRLVARQRIHRVEQNRFDASLPPITPAVVERRIQEALGLPRPRPGGHQRVLRLVPLSRIQPLECPKLMPIGQDPRPDI